MAEAKLLDKNKEKTVAKIMLKGITPAYVNTLRRYMMDEVPTMAIDTVDFKKNSSLLYDEIIAHRLGLTVLATDLKSYTLPAQCTCKGEGCAKCQVKLTLKAKGPCVVQATDLSSKDPKIKPIYGATPIVKLIKQGNDAQELEFEATATLGQGKEHAKWSVGHFHYTYKPTVTVNTSKDIESIRHQFPEKIFNRQGKIDKNLIIDNDLVDAVDGIDKDVVKVEYDENSFIFIMESWGALDVKTIAVTATEIFDEQLDEFEAALKA